MKISELSWPTNSQIDLIVEAIGEEATEKLLFYFCDQPESVRKIRLPKRQTITKVMAYYYGIKIAKKEMTWEKVMKGFKSEFGFLKNVGITQKKFKAYYSQRLNEILMEKKQKKIGEMVR